MLIRLHQELRTAAADPDGKDPPKEFRIFAFGRTETSKGAYEFDRGAGEKVIATQQAHGAQLALDYEHASLEEPAPPSGAPAAGWYDLELRDDGLWAVNVKWTPRATEYLKNSEYRYISPAFRIDPKTRKVSQLLNVALTNLPATHGLEPLVAAKAVPFAAGPVVSGAWDGDAAEGRLRRWASSDGSGDKSTIDWPKYEKGFAYFDPPGDALGDYHLPHHDVQGGKLVVSRRGVEAAAAAVAGARGAHVPAGDLAAVKAHLAKHYREWGARAPWEPQHHSGSAGEGRTMETLLLTLGLKDTATEAEAVAEINARETARTALEQELLTLTGAKSLSEAKGQLAALKAKADAHDAAQTELAKLKAESLEREVASLVDEGVREGKVPPAMKEFWLGQGRRDVEMLKAFLTSAPKLVATKSAGATGEGSLVTLSEDDKETARTLGISEANFLKARQAAGSKP